MRAKASLPYSIGPKTCRALLDLLITKWWWVAMAAPLRASILACLQRRLREKGYYVISIDQRGFGESSGTVRVMSPDYEGQSLIALLDWAENLPGLARFADNKMVVGSYGGSYGGMYQYLLAAADPQERLRVIAPDITPYDLSYSLSSHNVPKSFWAAGLAAMGELSPFGSWADDFPEGFIKFWQRELIENEIGRASC